MGRHKVRAASIGMTPKAPDPLPEFEGILSEGKPFIYFHWQGRKTLFSLQEFNDLLAQMASEALAVQSDAIVLDWARSALGWDNAECQRFRSACLRERRKTGAVLSALAEGLEQNKTPLREYLIKSLLFSEDYANKAIGEFQEYAKLILEG